jgi:hypothetical protein
MRFSYKRFHQEMQILHQRSNGSSQDFSSERPIVHHTQRPLEPVAMPD